jgi:ElaB/YqjD/DUF883 family membrane-anchored ribosome-binding protein
MNNLVEGAKNFGSEFVNQAQNNGLLNDAMRLVDDSGVGKAIKGVVQKAQNGLENLKKLKDKAETFVNNKINDAKKLGEKVVKKGEGLINKAKDKVAGYVEDAKKYGEEMKGRNINDSENNFRKIKQNKSQSHI